MQTPVIHSPRKLNIGAYVRLTKPGIIVGNLISTLAGIFLAAKTNPISWELTLCTLAGVALIIASGCMFNNIFDKDIDAKMARTANRPLVTGEANIDVTFVLVMLSLLLGTWLLYHNVNPMTAVVVLLGYVFYVFFYTMWYKRNSVYGTLVGSVSGAIPPLAGYIAVTNYIDINAALLFALFSLWQMPHSYAIAMFRRKDYQEANIPVLPLVEGIQVARSHMQAYVVVFSLVALGLFLFGEAGYAYLAISSLVCFGWLKATFSSFDSQQAKKAKKSNQVNSNQLNQEAKQNQEEKKVLSQEDKENIWAKSSFKHSLFVVMGLSFAMGIEFLLTGI